MNKIIPAVLAIGVVLAGAGISTACASSGGRDNSGRPLPLKAVRALTEHYHEEAVALADGFTRTDDCVPQMGYHYVNFGRMDQRLEPTRPEAVLYGPTSDGTRRLVGAEWIVIDDDQNLATDYDRPSLFGHEFQGPMLGHTPGMPIHYDLHAYAWLDNPNGGFVTFNPAVSCNA